MILCKSLLVTICFIIINLYAEAQSADFSGDWDTSTNWDTDSSPSTDINNTSVTIGSGFDIDYTGGNDITFVSNGSGDLTVDGTLSVANDIVFPSNAGAGHTITVTGDMTIDGSVIFEANANVTDAFIVSGNLTISGDLIMENNAGSGLGITIQDGGILIIQGSWTVANGALNSLDIDLGGTLVVSGDFDTGSGSNIDNNGSVYAGSYSGNSVGSITGDPGITGDLDDLADDDTDVCANTSGCSSSLPVELLNYKLDNTDGIVVLQWITSSEINNDYFDIEKSLDGKTYEYVARVDGNGNSTTENVYQWTDAPLSNVITYYKLIQYDFDGAFEVLGIEAYHPSIEIPTDITIYPNDTRSGSKLTIVGGNVNGLVIYNSIGIVVMHEPLQQSNDFSIPAYFESGLYFVKLTTSDGFEITKRLLVK